MAEHENRRPTILLVDDDVRVLKSLKIWFSNEGMNVFTAQNGSDALKIIIDECVDVALVDFRIGKEDGIKVARHLKEADEQLIIVILTGFPSYETAVQAMKIGVFDYLAKSSPNEKIMSVIQKAIQERDKSCKRNEQDTSPDHRSRLVLFCDHSLIKERLENYLKNCADFKLVMSLPSVESFRVRNLAQEIHIALVCAGCNIKSFKDAYTVFPELYRSFPGIKTLIINESFADMEKVELLRLGIRGFFSLDSSCSDLEKALHHIAHDELWVSRRVIQLSLQYMTSFETYPAPKSNDTFGLTSREMEILKKIKLGMKNREIGDELIISEQTVKTHINRIFKKLGVDSRTKAILSAMERKII